jgi:hypothetical protein
MHDERPRRLPPLGFAGFEASSAAAGRRRRKSRWAINPLRDGARASAEAAGPQASPPRLREASAGSRNEQNDRLARKAAVPPPPL